MKRYTNFCAALTLLVIIGSCKKKDYSMGDLSAPSDVTINTRLIGQDATHPNGNGSGDVEISITGKNILSSKIDYDASNGINLEFLPTGKITRKFSSATPGLNKYRLTVVAYGAGATATTVTKDIQVQFDFIPAASIISNLTGSGSKTWKVDKDVAGHLGVGPWDKDAGNASANITPSWWSAGVNEKLGCCNCFYSASFVFTKTATGYTITSNTPDGAFTKTGDLAGGLPGIPAAGDEGCYAYSGGTSSFSFVPSGSDVPAASSTKVGISLGGNNTFIGYGAVQKEYEILSITATTMYLRVRGTEPGNAWYLKLKSN